MEKQTLTTASQVKSELRAHSSKRNAKNAQRFFKTGPGEYGFGDVFIGVRMPDVRYVASLGGSLPISELSKLVKSRTHEHRMAAFVICANQLRKIRKRGDLEAEESIVSFYLNNLSGLNNWDLIDVTVPHVLGPYYLCRNRRPLYEWISSKNLWIRRIALLTTQAFIRENQFKDTLALCAKVLNDQEDLIHKASGWMLREVGKRDARVLREFLKRYSKQMPRTMLRYAIEKFSDSERRRWLA